jgi:hypothetical protein
VTHLNPKFNDLRTLHIPAVMSDDEREFQSDMAYLRDLLNAIVIQAADGGHCSPWPDDLKFHLFWLEDQVNHDGH